LFGEGNKQEGLKATGTKKRIGGGCPTTPLRFGKQLLKVIFVWEGHNFFFAARQFFPQGSTGLLRRFQLGCHLHGGHKSHNIGRFSWGGRRCVIIPCHPSEGVDNPISNTTLSSVGDRFLSISCIRFFQFHVKNQLQKGTFFKPSNPSLKTLKPPSLYGSFRASDFVRYQCSQGSIPLGFGPSIEGGGGR